MLDSKALSTPFRTALVTSAVGVGAPTAEQASRERAIIYLRGGCCASAEDPARTCVS